MAELTEEEHREYQGYSRELGDMRQGQYAAYISKNWWRRSKLARNHYADAIIWVILAGTLVWAGLLWVTQLSHPVPPPRDYPYVIRQTYGDTGDYWLAKKYYATTDGGIVVMNEDVMIKHNRILGDMGCYIVPESIPQLEFAPYTVTIKER